MELETVREDSQLDSVLSDVRRVRLKILEMFPSLFPTISDKDIYLTHSVPTVSVTDEGDILVNPDFWRKIGSFIDKMIVLVHECMHIELMHPQRFRGGSEYLYRVLWNISTDAFINSILLKIFGDNDVLRISVLPKHVYEIIYTVNREEAAKYSPQDFENMTEEEMYYALVKAFTKQSDQNILKKGIWLVGNFVKNTFERGMCSRCIRSTKIEAVDRAIVGKKRSEMIEDIGVQRSGTTSDEDMYRQYVTRVTRLKRILEKVMKSIGRESGDITEVLEKLTPRGSVNWVDYLISTVNTLLRQDVVSTYMRINRRFPHIIPGYVKLHGKQVKTVFLIDVSGSIDSGTLRRFLEEVIWAKTMLGDRIDGYVVMWDVDVKDVKPLKEIHPGSTIEVTGRGGTVIDKALQKVLEVSENEELSMVVVLTDGYLYLDDPSLPREIASRVKHAILLYTDRKPSGFEGWEILRYERSGISH
ncbi:MAG: VWA-like domain-containing protein [Ignisphaera sp.]